MSTKTAVIRTCDYPANKAGDPCETESEIRTVGWFNPVTGQPLEMEVCEDKHLAVFERARDRAVAAMALFSEKARSNRPRTAEEIFGRSSSSLRRSSARHGSRTPEDRAESAAIRAWAKAQKIEISERGRIPASVIMQYNAAHAPAVARTA